MLYHAVRSSRSLGLPTVLFGLGAGSTPPSGWLRFRFCELLWTLLIRSTCSSTLCCFFLFLFYIPKAPCFRYTFIAAAAIFVVVVFMSVHAYIYMYSVVVCGCMHAVQWFGVTRREIHSTRLQIDHDVQASSRPSISSVPHLHL